MDSGEPTLPEAFATPLASPGERALGSRSTPAADIDSMIASRSCS